MHLSLRAVVTTSPHSQMILRQDKYPARSLSSQVKSVSKIVYQKIHGKYAILLEDPNSVQFNREKVA